MDLVGRASTGGADSLSSSVLSERQALEPVCIALGDQQTLWALDTRGNLWFRTGIVSKRPQGGDEHWWQVGALLRGACGASP